MKTIVKNILWALPVMAAFTVNARQPDGLVARQPKQPNLQNTKAAACAPATAVASMDFNNVRARIENGGNMWQNRSNSTAAYEVPRGGGIRSIFAGSLWMGGKSPNGQLKLAAVTFRGTGNDFWPGPLTNDGTASTSSEVCSAYDRFFKAKRSDVQLHAAAFQAKKDGTFETLFPNGYSTPGYFSEWPATSGDPNYDRYLAPFFDFDENGEYDPEQGDYPKYDLFGGPKDCREATREVPLFGDTTIYWIFNDKGNIHTETGSEPIGMEIRAQAFSFADKSAINNMTFYNYVLINQGTTVLENTYFGQWADVDLGNPADDFVGCDVSRGLGFVYNGDNDDDISGGNAPGYGATPPALGIDFFQGPFQDFDGLDNIGPYDSTLAPCGKKTPITYNEATQGGGIPYLGLGIGYGDCNPGGVENERFGMRKFLYYNIGGGASGDPTNGVEYYNYLTGLWRDNSRFVYGGNAHYDVGLEGPCPAGAIDPNAFCDFMFPGETDSLNFGTLGNSYGCMWDENTAGNAPGDRRFMQSAGPFKLQPGAVNNITVGVVWARASAGDALASVADMKKADDLAQGLFDNCFQLFEGPDAPDITVTELDGELVLSLTNGPSSNNFNEGYARERTELKSPGVDAVYRFEGYLVYQVKDATVTPAELSDPLKARVIFQSDIKNFNLDPKGKPDPTRPIKDLVNYEFDADTKLPVPVLKVKGSNKGILRSVRVTEDIFSTKADKSLINHRPYYFIAIAYGYNNFQNFNPSTYTGQSEVFISSRKTGRAGAITPAIGIPHILMSQEGGTIVNSSYGLGLPVTRYAGAGNGGNFTDITEETEANILRDTSFYDLEFKANAGPVAVKVVDPLKIRNTEWDLKVLKDKQGKIDSATWILTDAFDASKVYRSEKTVTAGGEQLILNEGISVNISQQKYYQEGTNNKTDFIGASLTFTDPLSPWLAGVPDEDGIGPQNWIRSGLNTKGVNPDQDANADYNEMYEGVLGGTWAPYALVTDSAGGFLPQNNSETARSQRDVEIARTTSCDIVFTADKSKWTRCPVIEAQDDPNLAYGGAPKGRLRRDLSVDKNGLNVRQGGNPAECNLVADSGMSWFPGYAINPETGDRLNMAFTEDSWVVGENGRDMIWNPSSNIKINGEYVGGGKHFIIVYKNTRVPNKINDASSNVADFMGAYDAGRTAYNLLKTNDVQRINRLWRNGNWVGLPLLAKGYTYKSMVDGFVPGEARLKLRVSKEYEPYPVGKNVTYLDSTTAENSTTKNGFFPLYRVKSAGYAPMKNQKEVAVNALDIIRAVPNPFYGYSEAYESGRLDNKIKFINLPQRCTISIYTVDGTIIRRFDKDNASTYVEWDLKTFANIPCASGAYLIHVDAPGIGEKVIKWFGVMRQVDLQNL